MTMRFAAIFGGVTMTLMSTPAFAQTADGTPTIVDPRTVRAADSSAGAVGQRQTRDDVTRKAGIQPMARLNNRVANRVQNRLRNRIDRTYDLQANTTSPFRAADEQSRSINRQR